MLVEIHPCNTLPTAGITPHATGAGYQAEVELRLFDLFSCHNGPELNNKIFQYRWSMNANLLFSSCNRHKLKHLSVAEHGTPPRIGLWECQVKWVLIVLSISVTNITIVSSLCRVENTSFRLKTEVKELWARIVVRWVTSWELLVLLTKTKAGLRCWSI